MLSEFEFVYYINKIQDGLEQRRKFDEAMSEFNTSFFVSNIGEDWLNGLIMLLETVMDDKPGKNGSYISWWLFESNIVDKKLIITDENNNDSEIDVSTPELLYKWLVERKVD
jgi:hypothetical protein